MKAKKDVYIESGWSVPNFANRFAHTFRYGDEFPDFEHRYPAGGLLEHIDYASLQKRMLGQRPNMGAIYDEPNQSMVNRAWLAAGLALGTHVTVGFDLTSLSREALSDYRSLLTHYDPFTGTTTFGRGLRPQTFATRRGGITYLGVLNRGQSQADIRVPLADHGLRVQPGTERAKAPTAYDVDGGRFMRLTGSFTATVPAQSFRLYIVRTEPGVLWTNSSFQTQDSQNDGSSLSVTLKGPDGLPGFAFLATPPPKRVTLDGVVLSLPGGKRPPGSVYRYDAQTGVLSLTYVNDPKGHFLRVEY